MNLRKIGVRECSSYISTHQPALHPWNAFSKVISTNKGEREKWTTSSQGKPWRKWGCRNKKMANTLPKKLHALHVHIPLFVHLTVVLVVSTWSQNQLCSFVGNMSSWRKSVNFLFLSPKPAYQVNSRPVSVRFVSQTARNNQEIIAKTPSYIFRWRPRRASQSCRSSLLQFESLVYTQQCLHVRIYCIIFLITKLGNNV